LMPMTARCGAAAPCRGPVRCCRAVPRRRMVGSCWLCGAHRTRAAAAACETRGNPDRGMSSSAFHTTSQRPAYVALYDPHSQPLEAPVQLSGLPRVFVHALAFSSTPSHADAAEFSSTPSHAAAAAHALCSFHHSPRVRQLSDSHCSAAQRRSTAPGCHGHERTTRQKHCQTRVCRSTSSPAQLITGLPPVAGWRV